MQLIRDLFAVRFRRGAVAVVLVLAAACSSGSGFSSVAGSASGRGSSGSVGSAVPPSSASMVSCPPVAPEEASACGMSPTCEYGTNADPSCNVIATCTDAKWRVDTRTVCPTTCPARYDALAPGDTCSDRSVCTYLEATCGCAGATATATGDAGLDASDDAGDEGGADAAAAAGRWQCVRPTNDGCPARRPVLGATCVKEMICDYGSCVFGAQLTFECVANRWIEGEAGCP